MSSGRDVERDARRETRNAQASDRVTRLASRVSICSILLAMLYGCAVSPHTSDTSSRDASTLTEWQASGRIAVSGASTGGSGSFTWSQKGQQAQVQMRGPVGIGSLRLTVSDQSLRIETADGQTLEADEAQSELTARLGAYVPARDLRYWLIGVAAPGAHQWVTAESTILNQQDWQIDYQRFGVTDGVRLPLKLVAVSGPAKVRILIDRWKVVR